MLPPLFSRTARRGFTLIELLVVVSIIAVIVSLLLPAVQAAREAARRKQCANNLKQLSLAVHGFHSSFNRLPTSEPISAEGSPIPHSWMIYVTPYLERQTLYDRYNFKKPWDDITNLEVVGSKLPELLCSSVPNGSRLDFSPPPATEPIAAASDYAALTYVDNRLASSGLVDVAGAAAMPKRSRASFTHIRDGLSKTLLLVESAGRPQVWQRYVEFEAAPTTRVNGGGWARPATDIALIGSSRDGTTIPGPCPLNCTNGEPMGNVYPHPYYQTEGTGQIFSFHRGTANVAFADGSVRSLDEMMDIRSLAKFVTRAGNEICQTPRN